MFCLRSVELSHSHLIADTQGHLGNLNVDEGVVHSSSLLHLINVINRMLLGRNDTIKSLCFVFVLDVGA